MTPRTFFYLLNFSVNIPAPVFSQRAENIAETLQQLRLIKIEDDHETDVPAATIPLLTRLKHDLLASFQQVLDEAEAGAQAATLQEDLLRRLRAAGVGVDEIAGNDPRSYGLIFNLEVKQPSGHSDLVIFRSKLSIQCGDDSSLYVFQKRQRRWRVIIAVESNGYKKVSGGLGNLLYSDVSPPDADGRWFLVYAHQEPWCTSNWNYIHYRVLRPGATPAKPMVLLSREEEIYRDELYRDRDLPKLGATQDSFRLEFEGSQALDTGVRGRS